MVVPSESCGDSDSLGSASAAATRVRVPSGAMPHALSFVVFFLCEDFCGPILNGGAGHLRNDLRPVTLRFEFVGVFAAEICVELGGGDELG